MIGYDAPIKCRCNQLLYQTIVTAFQLIIWRINLSAIISECNILYINLRGEILSPPSQKYLSGEKFGAEIKAISNKRYILFDLHSDLFSITYN